jgi:hypothetical protein
MTTRERAHREAMRASIASIAGRLQEMLGQRITAYAVGIKDPRAIGRYAREQSRPGPNTTKRLRELFEITQVLLARETAETVRAWLLGSHPLLEDRSPIELLHSEDHPPVQRTAATDANVGYLTVVSAAEEFVRSA